MPCDLGRIVWSAVKVNESQTYRHQISGGYLWSPERNANKARIPIYESMREVAPGDIIFSFRDTRIAALGIARSSCYESPKPTKFGPAGSYCESIGWKIDVSFRELDNRIHPKSHISADFTQNRTARVLVV
jgi:putative restriction endonuclease